MTRRNRAIEYINEHLDVMSHDKVVKLMGQASRDELVRQGYTVKVFYFEPTIYRDRDYYLDMQDKVLYIDRGNKDKEWQHTVKYVKVAVITALQGADKTFLDKVGKIMRRDKVWRKEYKETIYAINEVLGEKEATK